MKRTLFVILSLCFITLIGCNQTGSGKSTYSQDIKSEDVENIIKKYNKDLQRLFEFKESVEHLHPFLNKLYPVAIVENDHFYVFDLDDSGEEYVFKTKAATEMFVPQGVRAAFPLGFYNNKIACVVTGDVFDSTEGYITIFHEFIHCHQWNTVEPGLKTDLPLAVKSMKNEDYMWEINYPFPYDNEDFEKIYTEWIKAGDNLDAESIKEIRSQLKDMLDPFDYQYMVWQEWKEGFALYVENRIRKHMGVDKNMVGRTTPYNRTAFYAGGAGYISYLTEDKPELLIDIEELFYIMKGSKY